jgi:3-isopropylmalate/(R)-2-methylmalate dehydratase small subunit
MPCVVATAADIASLREAIENDPNIEITIDVENKKVRSSNGMEFSVEMPESAREALVSGRCDPILELLDNEDAINATAEKLHYV